MNGFTTNGRSVMDRRMTYASLVFADMPTRIMLPTKGPRPATGLYITEAVPLMIPAGVVADLEALAHRLALPLVVPLLASWAALLSRWTGEEDVIGTRLPRRSPAEGASTDTPVNTIGVRVCVREDLTVEQLLRNLKTILRKAVSNQEGGFEQMAEALNRAGVCAPELQVMMDFNVAPDRGSLTIKPLRSPFELALLIREDVDGISGKVEYASECFERETIDRLVAGWEVLLGQMIGEIYQPVRGL